MSFLNYQITFQTKVDNFRGELGNNTGLGSKPLYHTYFENVTDLLFSKPARNVDCGQCLLHLENNLVHFTYL